MAKCTITFEDTDDGTDVKICFDPNIKADAKDGTLSQMMGLRLASLINETMEKNNAD